MTLFTANANSLKNKIESLMFNISLLEPQVIVVQEKKLKRASQITLKGYRCFTTIRGDSGGGLLIASRCDLDPVQIFEGDNECEVLVVQVQLDDVKIRIIAVEEQVSRAYLSGCMVIIAEDANAKLGPAILKDDIHPISENGKLLAAMINRQRLSLIHI